MEPCIQRFEAGNLLDHCRGNPGGFLFGDDRNIVQEQTKHALLLEAPPELPHGFRMGVRVVGALPGRTIFKEDQGTDEFIPPLHLIDKAQLQLRKVTGRFHEGSLYAGHLVPRGRPGLEAPGIALKRVPQTLSAPHGTACSVVSGLSVVLEEAYCSAA